MNKEKNKPIEVVETLAETCRRFYQMGYDEAEKEYHLGLAELKAAIESLPDSKPYRESDEFDAGLREMKHACLNVIAERITLLT